MSHATQAVSAAGAGQAAWMIGEDTREGCRGAAGVVGVSEGERA